jgi:uncharacterized protein (DUF58 family)
MRLLQVSLLLTLALAFTLATGNLWVLSATILLSLVLVASLASLLLVQARVRAVVVAAPATVVPWGGTLGYRAQLRAGRALDPLQPAVVFLVDPGPRGLPGQPLGQVAAQVGAGWSVYGAEGIPCLDRGCWTIGPVEALTADPFGILPARRHLVLPRYRVRVLPRWVELVTCSILEHDGLRPGDGLSRRRDQEPPITIGCRAYALGDPLRRLHWPQTARQRTLMTRVYESPPLRQASWYLLLDLEGEAGARYVELLVTIAASLAVLLGDARRSTRRLGLVVGGEVGWIAPAEGSYGDGASGLQDILAEVIAGDEAPLAAQLEWLGRRIQAGDVAVLVTAAEPETRADLLGTLAGRGIETRVLQVRTGDERPRWPVPALCIPAELADPAREDELTACVEGELHQTSARLVAVRAVG